MLFMVIEQFRNSDPKPVRQRFLEQGRLLPEGVITTPAGSTRTSPLYQLMDAPDLDKVRLWTQAWDDIVDFEIVPVETSQDFWARFGG